MPLTRLLQIKVWYSQIPSLLGAQLSWEFYGETLKWQYAAYLRGFSQWGQNRRPSHAFPETSRQLFRGKLLVN